MHRSLTPKKVIVEKTKESLAAILPVLTIVLALSLTAAPLPSSIMLTFLFGTVLFVVGMMFFTLGAEMSMTVIGEKTGGALTGSRSVATIAAVAFLIGFIVTVAEPDLQVLARQVPSVPTMTLILAVSAGVGIFLVAALLRMLFRVPLSPLLVGCYILVFALSAFVPRSFIAVCFDSGGVTTGPMTVPFIMALGVGVCAIRSDRSAADDSFGLVALCSVGPIIAVMILGIIYSPESGGYVPPVVPKIGDSVELGALFARGIPTYMAEMALSLLPIAAFFLIFQLAVLKLTRAFVTRVVVGLAYTYVGLVLFLTGVNIGFMPAGNYLGGVIASGSHPWALVPVAMVMGFFAVRAEPAVYVLKTQVEEITDGGISAGAVGISLSIGVAVSLGISMIRVLTGINIMWFLLPCYALSILISFFVPKIYTAIAFDSGGVASGPVTAAFLLPFAQGACVEVGGDIVADAFGVVAMVAMTPLLTIQVLGLISKLAEKRSTTVKQGSATVEIMKKYGENDIIEL